MGKTITNGNCRECSKRDKIELYSTCIKILHEKLSKIIIESAATSNITHATKIIQNNTIIGSSIQSCTTSKVLDVILKKLTAKI